MKELKPFDLEAAKRGEPICFDDGEEAKYIGMHPIENQPVVWGECYGVTYMNPDLLRMAPKKRTVWVNFYTNGEAQYQPTKQSAIALSYGYIPKSRIAIAVPVEIEE